MRIALICTSTLSLCACSTAMEAVRGPDLAPAVYPAALVGSTGGRIWTFAPTRAAG